MSSPRSVSARGSILGEIWAIVPVSPRTEGELLLRYSSMRSFLGTVVSFLCELYFLMELQEVTISLTPRGTCFQTHRLEHRH